MIIVGFEECIDATGIVSRGQLAFPHFVHGIPDLLVPSTQGNPLLVPFNGLLVLTQIPIGIGDVEVIAAIVRLFFKTLLEEANVTREFIGLASTIANVVDIDLEEAVARKYGTGCPGCGQRACVCPDAEKP
jgi:hypothetical protein